MGYVKDGSIRSSRAIIDEIGDSVYVSTRDSTSYTYAPAETRLAPWRVIVLGICLILIGMAGFYYIDGMIVEGAEGSKPINAFYCSVITLTTIGFGDICPGETGTLGRVFLTILPLVGLGFFCGPILDLASSWKRTVPGGITAVGSLTLALGVFLFTTIEGMTTSEAVHLTVITGTTIGYGNSVPHSDAGRLALAIYAILVCNVVGGLLEPSREYFEAFCLAPRSKAQRNTQ